VSGIVATEQWQMPSASNGVHDAFGDFAEQDRSRDTNVEWHGRRPGITPADPLRCQTQAGPTQHLPAIDGYAP